MTQSLTDKLIGLMPTLTKEDILALTRRSVTVFNVIADAAVGEVNVWMAPCAGYLEGVYFIPMTALAKHATAYDTLTVQKNPLSAYGTPVTVATAHTEDITAGVAMDAETPWELSTYTEANRPFVKGDCFNFILAEASTPTTPLGALVFVYRVEDS